MNIYLTKYRNDDRWWRGGDISASSFDEAKQKCEERNIIENRSDMVDGLWIATIDANTPNALEKIHDLIRIHEDQDMWEECMKQNINRIDP